MLTSVGLVTALMFGQAQGALTLSGARVTYGELGATRTDLKFLPGDIFFVAFDIDGIKVDEAGRIKYMMGMEVVNKDGQPVFKQAPQQREDFLPLGGTKLPARAFVTIGIDQAPGTYTCKVTVVDRATMATQTLEQKFDVLPKTFGLVQVYTSADSDGKIPNPPLGVTGQAVFVHFALVGFARDTKTKQPDVEVEMSVVAKDGMKTLAKPTSITINSEVGLDDNGIPLRFQLPLNRPGDFTIELRATDKVAKGSAKISIPVRVLPAN